MTQGSQTPRSFSYDSLKRLTSATNPESGNTAYDYDANGNLLHKTDARSITATYQYDALNRVISRSYSDATPAVTYSYDTAGIANAQGRLTKVSSSVSVTSYAGYDVLGRVTSSSQQTSGHTYSMSYEYDLAGNLTREIYPTGRVITHTYDAAGRIASVAGQKANQPATPYVSQISYTVHGAVASQKLGAVTASGEQRWEHTLFNSRLQPVEIAWAARPLAQSC